MDEYNVEMIKLRRMRSQFDPFEDILVKNYPSLIQNTVKCYSTSLIRKIYEWLATVTSSNKFADRLTKDVNKSFQRKLLKYSRYQSSRRMFDTVFHSLTLTYLSSYTFELFRGLVEMTIDYRRGIVPSFSATLYQIMKNIQTGVISLGSYSLGYAVGGYFFGANFGADGVAILFELAASAMVASLHGSSTTVPEDKDGSED